MPPSPPSSTASMSGSSRPPPLGHAPPPPTAAFPLLRRPRAAAASSLRVRPALPSRPTRQTTRPPPVPTRQQAPPRRPPRGRRRSLHSSPSSAAEGQGCSRAGGLRRWCTRAVPGRWSKTRATERLLCAQKCAQRETARGHIDDRAHAPSPRAARLWRRCAHCAPCPPSENVHGGKPGCGVRSGTPGRRRGGGRGGS